MNTYTPRRIHFLRNENTGQIKQAKLGFSWTVFFFGFFPAIFRGDWKWFLIILIASAFTFGFSNLVFCFIYNKIYINELLSQGYKAADEYSLSALQQKNIVA
ncbi:hypothetical protein BLX05_17590 [Bacillus pseudomycoides]|nr:hypothetical protein BLX05_17590 [Bacillus pseudomycoides]